MYKMWCYKCGREVKNVLGEHNKNGKIYPYFCKKCGPIDQVWFGPANESPKIKP